MRPLQSDGGIVERVIGTAMRQIHELPGTTFSNPVERMASAPLRHHWSSRSGLGIQRGRGPLFFECAPNCCGVAVAALAPDILDGRVAGLEQPVGGVHAAVLDVGLGPMPNGVVEASRERSAAEPDCAGQIFTRSDSDGLASIRFWAFRTRASLDHSRIYSSTAPPVDTPLRVSM